MAEWEKELSAAAEMLAKAKKAVASCGAGFSAESNISTFRDPGGLWDKIDPMEMGTATGLINAVSEHADKLMPILFDLLNSFEAAEPNPGHAALSELEKLGILQAVITQNVDNLHQEAGSNEVIEVHGNLFRMRCLSCHAMRHVERKDFIKVLKKDLAEIKSFTLPNLAALAPSCHLCGFMMRPDVVMFGESVQELPRASKAARSADVMLVLGTSGVVYPAAYFPIEAKKSGASVIVINPTENAFSDVSDVYIPMKTGEALPEILDRMNKKRGLLNKIFKK